jgi:hypothetical protein
MFCTSRLSVIQLSGIQPMAEFISDAVTLFSYTPSLTPFLSLYLLPTFALLLYSLTKLSIKDLKTEQVSLKNTFFPQVNVYPISGDVTSLSLNKKNYNILRQRTFLIYVFCRKQSKNDYINSGVRNSGVHCCSLGML